MSKLFLRTKIVNHGSNVIRGFENDSVDDDSNNQVPMVDTVDSKVDVVIDEHDDIENQIGELDDNTEALESMSKYYHCAKESLAYGGMNKPMALLFDTAIKDSLRQMKLGINGRVTPSLESFGGSGSRLEATQISIEGIGDFLKSLWTKIVEGLKSLMAKLEEWWDKLFDQVTGLIERTNKLKERATATNGTIGQENEYESSNVAKVLSLGASVNVNDLVKDIGEAKDMVKSVTNGFSVTLNSGNYLKAIIDFIANYNDDAKAKNAYDATIAANEAYKLTFDQQTEFGDKSEENLFKWMTFNGTRPFIGNMVILRTTAKGNIEEMLKDKNTGTESISAYGFEDDAEEDVVLEKDNPTPEPKKESPSKFKEILLRIKIANKITMAVKYTSNYANKITNKIKASSKSDCISLTDTVTELLSTVSEFKKMTGKSREFKSSLRSAALKAVNVKTEGNGDSYIANATAASALVVSASRNIDLLPSGVSKYALSLSKACLNHVEKSLSMHVS